MESEQYNMQNAILTVKIGLMKRGDVYHRRVYTIFDLISAFGGLTVGLIALQQLLMVVYSKRWFKLALTESEFKMNKAHPKKGRINTVKGNKKKSQKHRKQITPFEHSMQSSGEFDSK